MVAITSMLALPVWYSLPLACWRTLAPFIMQILIYKIVLQLLPCAAVTSLKLPFIHVDLQPNLHKKLLERFPVDFPLLPPQRPVFAPTELFLRQPFSPFLFITCFSYDRCCMNSAITVLKSSLRYVCKLGFGCCASSTIVSSYIPNFPILL